MYLYEDARSNKAESESESSISHKNCVVDLCKVIHMTWNH